MKEDNRSNGVIELISKNMLNTEKKRKIFVRLKKSQKQPKIFWSLKNQKSWAAPDHLSLEKLAR